MCTNVKFPVGYYFQNYEEITILIRFFFDIYATFSLYLHVYQKSREMTFSKNHRDHIIFSRKMNIYIGTYVTTKSNQKVVSRKN